MQQEIFKVYKDTRIFSKNGKLRCGALWEVSNLGNVRKNGEEFIPYSDRNGYLRCSGGKYQFKVHRAVAELFVENPEPENKKTVDHINRDRTDNRVCNLRWATMSEQVLNKCFVLSEEAREKMSAAKIGNKNALGNKNTFGRIWVSNPTTNERTLIKKDELQSYLDNGYIRGRKIT